MGTRLVALVLVPMLGFGLFALGDARDRDAELARSRAVQDAVERVRLHAAADLLTNERVFLLGAMLVGRQYGLDEAGTSSLIGIDIAGRKPAVDAELDRIIDALRPDDPLRDRAIEVRRRLAAAAESPTDTSIVSKLSDASGELSEQALDDAEEVFLRSGASHDLGRLHLVASTALNAMNDIGFQIEAAGLLHSTEVPAERLRLLRRLRRATAEYDRDRTTLAARTTGNLRIRWAAIDDDPGNTANARWLGLLADTGADDPVTTDPLALARVVGGGVQRMQSLGGLAVAALDDAHEVATAAAAAAADERRQSQLFAAGLLVTSMVLLVVIARSIGRPIRSLTAAAEQVSEGDLHGAHLTPTGPPEMRRVTSILGEVMTNLRTVEAQVEALAAGELDDEVLTTPVPGRLGSLLHASVRRLSGSMAEREALQQRLHHEATHDPLTGLPNRSAARDALAAALERGRRRGEPVAALFVDLDGFKQVNDAHGHGVGDHVLQVTAEQLRSATRAGDLAARIGGDEFVVVAESAGGAFAMRELGERIIEAISAPVTVGSVTTRVSASVGIAMALDGETDADGVLRDADQAAYRAKQLGRARVELFDEHLRAEVAHRLDVEERLRAALDADQLALHFQPVVTPDGTASSVEALVRWQLPDGTYLPPGDFIPVAEGSDLIVELDRWVLDRACRQLRAWEGDPVLGALSVSVNLSGRHLLNLAVVDDVQAILERTGADPRRLLLEITETVLITDLPLVTDHLDRLRALGIRIAIDDFGTGYTSLNHLRVLPVDVVKIDRSMVVGERPNDHHVLKLLVDLVHALGLRMVAEGVETGDQLERLKVLGCDQIQGYLFSRPVPVDELAAALAAAGSRAA